MGTLSKKILFLLFVFCSQIGLGQEYKGFFNFQFDDATGKMLLEIKQLNEAFLMVNAFGTGVGSNDIGMDRGKLNATRVVNFEKHGDKILLVQQNLRYRAQSNNLEEVKSVEEAFAKSVLFGFKIEKTVEKNHYIDIAPFLMDDNNLVVQQLKEGKQGNYKLEKSRSALFFDNIHAFEDNCEFEAILTFIGDPMGDHIKSVTPSPESVSYRQHISFIRLPDTAFKPRAFHPECGFFYTSFYDYATPIHEPLEKRFITRHRLEKKEPGMAFSEVRKPIIYYIDPGCPEPIKSALVEGGKWWKQAFEAAGFKNAFDIRELPKGAHPLDVRYNMIQWVHRSTRGWSYGASITDPRTGEILKGHVSLGSLRVRQDFLIAQGLTSPYKNKDTNHDLLTQMALDRLKQLSAHEIGHTIGLAHNFAASTNDRSSVMDYPHPYITSTSDGTLDFSKAYDHKIGVWDKRAIMYGYTEYPSAVAEQIGLKSIIEGNHTMGLHYLTDEDARSLGSASPITHLWDNGKDATDELKRIMEIRTIALRNFGLNTITNGTPVSELEKVFVPVYYMHRYQVEAVGKLIGGMEYTYAVKGFGAVPPLKPVSDESQEKALQSLLNLLTSQSLIIPKEILQWMYPPAYGYPRSRESFPTSAEPAFDSQKVYESAVSQIMEILLQKDRLNRIHNQGRLIPYLKTILQAIVNHTSENTIQQIAEIQFISKLLQYSISDQVSHAIKTGSLSILLEHTKNLSRKMNEGLLDEPHNVYVIHLLSMKPEQIKDIPSAPTSTLPPGAPIGSCSLD